MEAIVSAWNSFEPSTKLLLGACIALSIWQYLLQRKARCKHCGGKMKKVHDTMLVERITDALTPGWEHEKDRSPGMFKCLNCGRERKYL